MKVAALVHFAMPWRCAGSETVLHEFMEAAHREGHETRIWVTNKDARRLWTGREPVVEHNGVTVIRVRNVLQGGTQMGRWKPDVVVSHHDHVLHSIKIAGLVNARSVFMVHNDTDLNARPLRKQPDLVVFNSDWVRKSLARFGEPRQSMTFHPPVTPDRHKVDSTGDAITLVNLNEDKGCRLFYQLAEQQPDRRFIGVVGGHGTQIVKRNRPNVQIVEHSPNMKPVWAQTRVLLMPSVAESYGLVAQEAGMNGIPTIAHPTPGLVENLGPMGLFCDRENLDEWKFMLQRLDNKTEYRKASQYAIDRADQAMRDTRNTLKTWTEWVGGV